MKIKDKYPEIIKLRETEEELPWDDMKSIKATIQLFTANLQETIDFLDNDCTADQFSWMSEVFDDISEKLQSWEFIDALERTADRFPKACSEYNIRNSIAYAIGVLPEEVYGQRFPDEPEEGKTKK